MTRHQTAAASRRMSAADAMPEGTRARMAAGRPDVDSGRPVIPWVLLGLGVGVLIVAVVGAVVVSWAAGDALSAIGMPFLTHEVVWPVFRGRIEDTFQPRSVFSQPHLFRYRVVEVTSFPERRVRPFERPLRAFWTLAAAQAFADALAVPPAGSSAKPEASPG